MKIVAVTACPTGIAHTYMAATRMEQAAKKLGFSIKVEKQGINGIEDFLTQQEIDEADVVILAVETKVKDESRFNNVQVYRCPVVAPIKNAEEVFKKAEEERKTQSKPKTNHKRLKNHILTGVSYMIPLVIAASVIMGIARVGAMMFGITDIWDSVHEGANMIGFFHTLDGLGGLALSLMLPIFSGFIAYSIADKPGLASGFSGGLLANVIGAGFFGALASGLIAGYLTKFLTDHIKFKGALSSLGTVFITPVCSVMLTMLLINYVVGVPFTFLNLYLIEMLNNMNEGSAVIMAIIIGAMVGFDLGGPVNKAAVVTAMGLIASGVLGPNTAAQVAIIVPALGYGIASLFFGKTMSASFKNAGNASFIMGLVGVSEGAIPFTLANPKVFVFFNMLGCAVASAIAVGFGAVNSIPISGIYGWLLVANWPIYVIAIVIGSAIVTLGAYLNHKAFQQESGESIL